MIPARRLAALAALLAAGCAERIDAPLSQTFGVAVASMDSQIVPAPVDPRPPVTSAARGVAAIRRYETGKVAAPVASTSNVSASSVSSSSTTSVNK